MSYSDSVFSFDELLHIVPLVCVLSYGSELINLTLVNTQLCSCWSFPGKGKEFSFISLFFLKVGNYLSFSFTWFSIYLSRIHPPNPLKDVYTFSQYRKHIG